MTIFINDSTTVSWVLFRDVYTDGEVYFGCFSEKYVSEDREVYFGGFNEVSLESFAFSAERLA